MLGARLGCVAPVFDHGLGRVDDAVPLGAPPPLRPRPGLQAGPRGGEDDAVLLEVVGDAAELQTLHRAVLLPRDDTRQVPDVDGEDVERNVEYWAVRNFQLNLQPRSEDRSLE